MRYLVFNSLPKHLTFKYSTSVSGGLFSMNLLNTKSFDNAFCILPIRIHNYTDTRKFDNFEVIVSKFRSSIRLLNILAILREQWKVFSRINNGSSVWLYNIGVLNILIYILLRLFKRDVKIFSVLADFTPNSKINRFILPFINRLDGIISLSSSDLFTVTNKVILPGIAPNEYNHPPIVNPIRKSFLISGALRDPIASIPMLLEVFKDLPECELHISGHEGDVEAIEAYSKIYRNIIYHGELSFDDFKNLLDSISFVLSTRNPSYLENNCNFPSKIIEALLHNRIVISTIHYEQLKGVKYFEAPCEVTGFSNKLKQICCMDDCDLITYANQSSTVISLYSLEVWKKTLSLIDNM